VGGSYSSELGPPYMESGPPYMESGLPYLAVRTSNSGRLSAVLYDYKEIAKGNFCVKHSAVENGN